MKHYLSILCFALMSFFFINKAAADLLLEQNPTPLEPASLSVLGEKYQLARVTWLPDYLKSNKGYGGGRINHESNGGGGTSTKDRTCAIYGYVSQCADGSSGTKVAPIPGLTCYKDCKSCKNFGLSESCGDKNVLATGASVRHPIPGLNCYDLSMDCKCPDEYKYTATGNYTCTLGGDTCYDMYHSGSPTKKYTQCACGRQYQYLGEPNAAAVIGGRAFIKCSSPATVGGSSCSFQGTGSYKLATGRTTTIIELYTECKCPAGYTFNNGTCVDSCAEYPLTVCPSGGNCTKCPDNANRQRLDTCDGADGWLKSGNNCIKKPCKIGYDVGVTDCSDKTKYTYSSSGKSGGQVCGRCTAKNDTCPTGYDKTACTSSQKQTGTTTTEIGSTCYKCEDLKNYVKLGVNAPEDNSQLSFSLSGSGYTIDWGDGTKDSNNSHTYAKAGDYIVVMTEGITQLIASSSPAKITKLYTLDMDTIKKATFHNNCDELIGNIPNFPPNLTGGNMMFNGCKGLTGNIPQLPSSLTEGTSMFDHCSSLTGNIPQLPSSLTRGNTMFWNCTGLTGNIPQLPSSLTNGIMMFNGCKGLTGNIPQLPSSLTNGNGMFSDCTGLTGSIPQLPSSLTSGTSMFSGCTGLTGNIPQLPSSLTNGNGMFSDCTGLTGNIPQLPSTLISGGSMFRDCSGLTGNIPQLPSTLTSGNYMFQNCNGLTGNIPKLPSSLADGRNMFAECTNLTGSIPQLPSSLTDGFGMFSACSKLTGTAPAKPAKMTNCDWIFNGTNVTITPEWSSCK